MHSKAAVAVRQAGRWHSLIVESLLPLPDGPCLVMVAFNHGLSFVVDFHHAHTVGSQVGHKVLHGEESIMLNRLYWTKTQVHMHSTYIHMYTRMYYIGVYVCTYIRMYNRGLMEWGQTSSSINLHQLQEANSVHRARGLQKRQTDN